MICIHESMKNQMRRREDAWPHKSDAVFNTEKENFDSDTAFYYIASLGKMLSDATKMKIKPVIFPDTTYELELLEEKHDIKIGGEDIFNVLVQALELGDSYLKYLNKYLDDPDFFTMLKESDDIDGYFKKHTAFEDYGLADFIKAIIIREQGKTVEL